MLRWTVIHGTIVLYATLHSTVHCYPQYSAPYFPVQELTMQFTVAKSALYRTKQYNLQWITVQCTEDNSTLKKG